MAEFSENRHISNLINMSCKVLKKGGFEFRMEIESGPQPDRFCYKQHHSRIEIKDSPS